MDINDQVALALRAHGDAEDGARFGAAYALGWIVANALVAARYRRSAIDAWPTYDPDHGWDRFLLTRRLSCAWCGQDAPDAFGAIALRGDDAPRLIGAGVDVGQGRLLRDDPTCAVGWVLDLVPALELPAGDHAHCWHERAGFYPTLYAVAVELILAHPGVAAARELFVDDQHLDGTYHPLYLHGIVTRPGLIYDWFSFETDERMAFVRINGEQAIYEADDGAWRSFSPQLASADRAEIKRRLRSWLRIGGWPNASGGDEARSRRSSGAGDAGLKRPEGTRCSTLENPRGTLRVTEHGRRVARVSPTSASFVISAWRL